MRRVAGILTGCVLTAMVLALVPSAGATGRERVPRGPVGSGVDRVVRLPAHRPGPPPAADPRPEHRVYVGIVGNRGDYPLSDQGIYDAVDGAIAQWLTQMPYAFKSLARVGAMRYASGATPSPEEGCGLLDEGARLDGMWQEVLDLFGTAVNPKADSMVIVVPPSCQSGSVAGLGTLGTDFGTMGVVVVKATADVPELTAHVFHELGHNFGLGHADIGFCDPFLRLCGGVEYGDCYSPMGSAERSVISSAHRAGANVLQPGELQSVAADVGDVHVQLPLAPRGAQSGVRGLRVTDPETGFEWYLDYRSGTGLDAGATYLSDPDCQPGLTATLSAPWEVTFIRTGPDGREYVAPGETAQLGDFLSAKLVAADPAVGAQVAVDIKMPPPFTTIPTMSLTGQPIQRRVVRLQQAGTFSPAPDRVQVRWHYREFDGTERVVMDGYERPHSALDLTLDGVREVWGELIAYKRGLRWTVASTPHQKVLSAGRSGAPRILGHVVVGRTVRAKEPHGIRHYHPRLRFRWFADGRAVPGGTGRRLTLSGALVGKRLTVVMIAKSPDVYFKNKESDPTRPVRR